MQLRVPPTNRTVLTVDPTVPGVEAAVKNSVIVEETDGMLRLQWQRVTRRSGLLHLLDVLEASGLDFVPSRQDALSGWDDMFDSETSGGPEDRIVDVPSGFQTLITRTDADPYVNHVYLVSGAGSSPPTRTALRFPPAQFDSLRTAGCHAGVARW